MLPEDKYFQTLSREELWKRYCGFLDLSIDEFMDIQKELMMDQIERVTGSTLCKKIMKDQKPATIEEFRRVVPLTTYEDYEPYLSERQEGSLATKTLYWCHSSGRGGTFKWLPVNLETAVNFTRHFLACWILASATKKGEVNVMPDMRLFANWPPPPYASGSGFQFFVNQFSADVFPPLDLVSQNGDFQARMQKGFEIGLRKGVDALTGLSSVLVKIGEGFSNKTRKRKFTASDLHPVVMYRFLKALTRSKLEQRSILPKDLWSPSAILCGGLDTQLYKKDVARYWGVEPFDFYVSTETTFLALQSWTKKAMTFLPDSVFLEFIPRDDLHKNGDDDYDQSSLLLLDELEEGKLYEVVITQFHGLPLLRYRMDDIIKVIALKDAETGISLPQFLIQGKVGSTIDLAGLCELDEKTVWEAISATGIKYEDWTACKEYDEHNSYIRILIELKENKDPIELAGVFDKQLKLADIDYKDIEFYLQLNPVKVTILSPGTFQNYFEEKVREGADFAFLKPTHMNPSKKIIERLLYFSETNKTR
ncbi:GH3 auxin-responsive promoter family protein [Chloroflexota bacterium]